jgi:hypothetical protein
MKWPQAEAPLWKRAIPKAAALVMAISECVRLVARKRQERVGEFPARHFARIGCCASPQPHHSVPPHSALRCLARRYGSSGGCTGLCRRRNPIPAVARMVGFCPGRSKMLDLSMRIDGLPLRQLAITNGSLCDIRNSCRQLLRLGQKPSTEGQYAAIPCRETRLSILFSDCCPAVPDKNRGQTRNQSFTPNFRRNVGEDAQARSERCARTAVPSLLNSPATPNCLPT